MPSRELCEACPWILRHPKLLEKLNAADIVTPVVVNSVRNDVVRKHAENQTTKYVERLRNLRSLQSGTYDLGERNGEVRYECVGKRMASIDSNRSFFESIN